ncbi:hypothetical protein MTO96_052184 [Rhipicephalus appendiculatus]
MTQPTVSNIIHEVAEAIIVFGKRRKLVNFALTPAAKLHNSEVAFVHEIAANVEIGPLPALETDATYYTSQNDAQLPKSGSYDSDHDYCGKHHAATQTDEAYGEKKQSKDLQPGFQSKATTDCQGTQAEFVLPEADVQDIDFNTSMEFNCPTLDMRSSTPVPTSSTMFLDETDQMPPTESSHEQIADEAYHPSFDESLEDCEATVLPLQESRKFVVFEENLKKELFQVCKVCQSPCNVSTKVCGSLLFVEAVCRDYYHTYKWQSQPMLHKKPAGNALLCAAVCFAGVSPEKVLRLLRHAGICVPSLSSYYLYQTLIMQPAINHVWEAEQRSILANLDEEVHLAGDGRCDSPGFSAKYMDIQFYGGKIEQVIKKRLTTESKKSACAELRAWIQAAVNHLYWCVAVSRGDGNLLVAMWKSMLNHVINVHAGHDAPYPRCLHADIPDGKWLSPGTPAYARLVAVATERTLLADMVNLSSSAQTSSLESFNSLLTKFAPKSVAFSSEMIRARTQLAILHNNENAGRAQSTTKSGEQKWKRKLLRSKKGEEVVCPVKTAATYAYLGKLIEEAVEICNSESFREARKKRSSASENPLPMTQQRVARPTKQELISSRRSRFAKQPSGPLTEHNASG